MHLHHLHHLISIYVHEPTSLTLWDNSAGQSKQIKADTKEEAWSMAKRTVINCADHYNDWPIVELTAHGKTRSMLIDRDLKYHELFNIT